MIAAAVLDTIDVMSGERLTQRVLDVDLERTLERMGELFGKHIVLHDGSRVFIEAGTVETPVEGTRITVLGPDKVAIEGITLAVAKVHHIRPLKDSFLK